MHAHASEVFRFPLTVEETALMAALGEPCRAHAARTRRFVPSII